MGHVVGLSSGLNKTVQLQRIAENHAVGRLHDSPVILLRLCCRVHFEKATCCLEGVL